MTIRDPNTQALLQRKLCIAEDVKVWPVHERGELVYRLEIPKLHRFFRVGYEEYVLISLLDGETTIPQACGLAASKLGQRAPNTAQAGTIARWLLSNELAHFACDEPPVRDPNLTPSSAEPSAAKTKASRLLQRFNPFWIKVPLPQSERWIGGMGRWFGPCFSLPAMIGCFMLLLIALVVLLSRWREFSSSTTNIFHCAHWFWLFASWLGLKVIHEIAHAAACHRAGGSVRESGIVIILFAPIAYVDVTSCWRMSSRWARIGVAAAGMVAELSIAAIALIAWTWTDSPVVRYSLHNIVVTAGLSTLLFNANVLMRFDGYFILSDFLEIPNLYQESVTATRRICTRWMTGEPSPAGHFVGWRKHFIAGYGLAATVWRFAICITLAIAASTMFAGAGILISLFGIVLWLGRPLKQFIDSSKELLSRDPMRFVRAALAFLWLIGIFGGIAFCLPLPTVVTVPAVAQYLPETTVRSRASGFVTKIITKDGAIVRAGDRLLTLENRALTTQLQHLEISHQQNAIRLRQASEEHDDGFKQILTENQRAISQQRRQLQTQVDGLNVIAPRDGRVVARSLESRLGQHVAEGDVILIVASESDKELVGVVDQNKIRSIRRYANSRVWIRTADFRVIPGQLDRIEPRATDRLPSPSLASTQGGPLAVTTVGDRQDDLRLLRPHFRVRVRLDESVAKQVEVGMRMETSFGYRKDTFAQRVRVAVREMTNTQ